MHEDGRLTLVERGSGDERAAVGVERPTKPLLAIEMAPGALRDALVAIVDVRALLGLVSVHSRVRSVDVLDDERKTVVRMALEEPSLVCAEGAREPLAPAAATDRGARL